jgi:hypothetical protein
MGADRAAGQILKAVRLKRPELTITVAAKMLVIAQALLPGLTANLIGIVARLLPRMSSPAEDKLYTGWESESGFSPSLLTSMADRATATFNGFKRYPPRR